MIHAFRTATVIAKGAPVKNPIPYRYVEENADLIGIYDAWESQLTTRMSLLVGLPATIRIGSDTYGATVVRVTKTTITVHWHADHHKDEVQTFRYSRVKDAWCSGSYRLSVGMAVEYRDPSF